MIKKNQTLIYSDHIILDLKDNKNIISWKILEIKNNKLHLEGEDLCWLPRERYFYFCEIGNKKVFPQYFNYNGYDFKTLYGTYIKGRIIIFDISLEFINDKNILHFYISYSGSNIEIFPSFSSLTHLTPVKNSYYVKDKYILFNNNTILYIYKYDNKLEKYLEDNYCITLKTLKKDYLIKQRAIYKEYKEKIQANKNNQIWLISDRKNMAGDNGEYFFRYLNNLNPEGIQFYFIIGKNCSDYNRLKKYNNIIDFYSMDYLNIFLKAEKILSSISDSWVYNPFNEDGKYISDLYHFDFIYLQNGVIKDDISKYLNRFSKNFFLLLTSSKKEYKYLLTLKYGYNEKNIALTGLPRLDNLKFLQNKINKKNIILLFPTWRMYIKGTIDLITHESIKSENFINTNYYNFYNSLINNDILLNIMTKNNYKGIFCIHPNFKEQLSLFKGNKIFNIKKNCNLQELIVKSSLLITDYSSIFFDFGYIKKPVIYTQFDYLEYRKYHFSEGYFDYKKDGFGPICYDMKCTIKKIIFEIENKAKMEKIYLRRIKRFFKYSDSNNCYRVYIELKNNNKSKNILATKKLYLYVITYIYVINLILKTVYNFYN